MISSLASVPWNHNGNEYDKRTDSKKNYTRLPECTEVGKIVEQTCVSLRAHSDGTRKAHDAPGCKDDAKRLNPLIRGDVWNVLNISHLPVTLLRRTREVDIGGTRELP